MHMNVRVAGELVIGAQGPVVWPIMLNRAMKNDKDDQRARSCRREEPALVLRCWPERGGQTSGRRGELGADLFT